MPHVLLISLLTALFIAKPVSADNSLEEKIKAADTEFFTAFNQCDIAKMESMFSSDLEFYHDIAGVSNKESTMNVTKQNCDRKLGLVRTLIPESLVVYPIKDFGAIQIGEHRFCHESNGKIDCGTFGFTHIWKKHRNKWLVHRVVSYGH